MPPTQETRQRFEALFREHHRSIHRFARRRVPAEAVDDIVADTFLVAWRRMDVVPDDALPWLLAVARNVVGTERRGRERRLRLWVRAQHHHLQTADSTDAAQPDDSRVVAALAQLSERDRETLTLVAWDGLTPAQAAEVLGVPANRFRVRLHRAGRRLREALAAGASAEQPDHTSPITSSTGASL